MNPNTKHNIVLMFLCLAWFVMGVIAADFSNRRFHKVLLQQLIDERITSEYLLARAYVQLAIHHPSQPRIGDAPLDGEVIHAIEERLLVLEDRRWVQP